MLDRTDTQLAFQHRFEPGREGLRPLLLLHGTGGNEHDLVPLGQVVAPGAPLLSPRGRISENGMPRFFRRFAEGRFDEEDVVRQAHALADFVAAARERYGLVRPLALGFSNGANIAAAVLALRPEVLEGAILLRAMTPLQAMPPADLAGRPVLIASGRADPIVPAADAANLAEALRRDGAIVEHRIFPGGHGLLQQDVDEARAFYARFGA